jgi:GT2 family glycosyltransferase
MRCQPAREISYVPSPGVEYIDDAPPRLRTPEGGDVVVDAAVADAWRAPQHADPLTAGCLAEARLLTRVHGHGPVAGLTTIAPAAPAASVTAVVVVSAAREMEWLPACVDSLERQTSALDEILIVDNASRAPLAEIATGPRCRVLPLDRRQRLASALNRAISATRGDYLLMLNPDVKLAPEAVAQMVARAAAAPDVAAVAPKTLFWRTPAFLNGVGNRVGSTNWGSDLGIGHLDLGQFDRLDELMSASLTVTLVARRAFEAVGGYDAAFRAYYEDAEWAYRARLLGWRILAAPAARAFHAFGGFWEPQGGGMGRAKLASAVSGRLRFTMLLMQGPRMMDVLRIYGREDIANAHLAWRTRDMSTLWGYGLGWLRAAVQLPGMRAKRRRLQPARAIEDRVLFDEDALAPPLLTWRNAPLLTSRVIRDVYAPLIERGLTRPAPEWSPG